MGIRQLQSACARNADVCDPGRGCLQVATNSRSLHGTVSIMPVSYHGCVGTDRLRAMRDVSQHICTHTITRDGRVPCPTPGARIRATATQPTDGGAGASTGPTTWQSDLTISVFNSHGDPRFRTRCELALILPMPSPPSPLSHTAKGREN